MCNTIIYKQLNFRKDKKLYVLESNNLTLFDNYLPLFAKISQGSYSISAEAYWLNLTELSVLLKLHMNYTIESHKSVLPIEIIFASHEKPSAICT